MSRTLTVDKVLSIMFKHATLFQMKSAMDMHTATQVGRDRPKQETMLQVTIDRTAGPPRTLT